MKYGEIYQERRFCVFIVNLEHISHLLRFEFLLLMLSK